MKLKSSLFIALFTALWALPCLCALSLAQALVLQPGETQTVNFDQLGYLEKGAVPQALPKVIARATLTLQADGKTLVVKFQHLAAARGSTAALPVALYAFDLGLSNKQAIETRAEVTFSEFPAKAMWMGPTDGAELTAGKGSFTFAAREAVLRNIDDYLRNVSALPPSFLTAGQQGCITIRLSSADVGKQKSLRLSPMAYFVVPEPTAPTARRLRMIARMSNGVAKN